MLFVDEVAERPFRIDRMLTQLRLSGILGRASAVVFGELPRCDEPDGSPTARSTIADVMTGFRGPVLFGLPSGHTTGPALTLPFGVRATVIADRQPRLVVEEAAVSCHAFISLASAALPWRRSPRCSRAGATTFGAPTRTSPADERFPGASGHHACSGLSARAHRWPTSISSSSATPSRAATPSSRKCSTARFATARCPEPFVITFSGRTGGRRHRYSRQDHDDLAGWLAADSRRLDPSMLVGGIAENFARSYRIGGGRDFVIEGDEYDSAFFDKTAKFLKYLPDIAVVDNIEFDHADIYPDLDAIRLTFQRFVNLVPRRGLLLLGADNTDSLALQSRRVAESRHSDFRSGPTGTRTTSGGGTPPRSACGGRRALGTFGPTPRRHNVRNALAAVAVGAALGSRAATMAASFRRFKGVRRRMQHRGTVRGISVYDDFAHHPTAIGETLDGVRSAHPGRRVWAIFEPRSATSCRRVFQADFAHALAKADRVPARGVPVHAPGAEQLSAERLVADLEASGVAARFVPDVDGIVAACRAMPARAISSSSCRMAASTTSIGSCCPR